MDFGSMLPLFMGMMGNKDGGNGGGNDMANIMSMFGNMNNAGGGNGGMPDMGMLMNMMKNFQGNNSKPREENERRSEDREEYRPRQADYPPSYYEKDEPPEEPPRRKSPPRDEEYERQSKRQESPRGKNEQREEPPRRRRPVHSFYEQNGIKNFEPLYFDEHRKQFGSRPIKNIAGDDINRKIDGYFSK